MTREQKAIEYLQTLNKGLRVGKICDALVGDNAERDEVFTDAIAALQFVEDIGDMYENMLLNRLNSCNAATSHPSEM